METNSHLFLLIWPLILITISQKLRFNIFNFFNFFDTKLRFHVFCYDLIWSAHMHVCIFYILSASSIIWLWNYFPSFPCYFSKVPYYNSGFKTIVYHSLRSVIIDFDPWSFLILGSTWDEVSYDTIGIFTHSILHFQIMSVNKDTHAWTSQGRYVRLLVICLIAQ